VYLLPSRKMCSTRRTHSSIGRTIVSKIYIKQLNTSPVLHFILCSTTEYSCLIVIKIWSWAPDGCLTQRQTGRLTVDCNVTSTLTSFWIPKKLVLSEVGVRSSPACEDVCHGTKERPLLEDSTQQRRESRDLDNSLCMITICEV
jgi:hypothetical protein